MITKLTILRYVLLIGGFLMILPHLLIRYEITDNAFVSVFNIPYGWVIGLLLCLAGFGWPEKDTGGSSRGDGIGWTSIDGGNDSSSGGGGGD